MVALLDVGSVLLVAFGSLKASQLNGFGEARTRQSLLEGGAKAKLNSGAKQ